MVQTYYTSFQEYSTNTYFRDLLKTFQNTFMHDIIAKLWVSFHNASTFIFGNWFKWQKNIFKYSKMSNISNE